MTTLIDLLTPYALASHAGLVWAGLTPDQAFDKLAPLTTTPEALAVIDRLQATPEGRRVLAQLARYWHAEGLPVPWDNVLILTPRELTP